jgi:hypothetical protein
MPILIVLILLYSCGLETAKPFKHQYVVLASDCLTPKDSSLFSEFTKTTGIKVRVIHLTSEHINKRLLAEGVETEIDALLLNSTYDALQTESKNLLQKVPTDSFPADLNSKYKSHRQMIAGLGFDPYVIIRRKEAPRVRNYASLLNSEGFATDLKDASSLAPFYLFLFHKHSGNDDNSAEDWIEDFSSKCIKKLSEKDTLIYAQLLFTKRSSFLKNKTKSLISYREGEMIFPNQRIGGAYYDMLSFGIVKQARNYSNTLSLLRYLSSNQGNRKLNKRLQTISFYTESRRIRFKRFHTSPLRMEKFMPDVLTVFN